MKLLKWSPFIYLGFVFIVLLWGIWAFIGYDIVRDMRCGPSSSISKPMAEAIVREINKRGRGTLEKVVKLVTLKNLPYKLMECEKEILKIEILKPKGIHIDFQQTCYFNDENHKYSVKFEYKGLNLHNNKLNMNEDGRIYIYIGKANKNETDLTKTRYQLGKYMGDFKYSKKWILFSGDTNWYSKKSKGRCKYKSPLKF